MTLFQNTLYDTNLSFITQKVQAKISWRFNKQKVFHNHLNAF